MFLKTLKNLASLPVVRLIAAILMLYLVFRQVDLIELGHKLTLVKPASLGFAVLASVIMAWLAGWRWAMILVPRKLTLTDHWLFFRATMLGLFYNLFMPSSVGGDILKWTALEPLKLAKKSVILTMLIDRVLGVLGLITLGYGGLVAAHFGNLLAVPELMWQVMTAAFGVVVAFLVLISTDWKWRQLPLLNKFGWVAEMESHIERHRPQFWAAFILSLIIQLIGVIIMFVLGKAVGFKLSLLQFLIIEPALGVAVGLPLNFAGFGATEVGFVYFFGLLGEASTTVLALTSLMAAIRFIVGGLGWLVGLMGSSAKSN